MKQEEIKRQAQKMVRSLQLKKSDGGADREMEEAVCKIIESILPKLEEGQGREDFLQNVDKMTEWVGKMPQSLRPGKRWSREEFTAVLAGPADQDDTKFGDYMDAFYEKYVDESEDEVHDFYEKLFQNEQQIDEVDWVSVWASIRQSYEHWRETGEEDEWLRGEREEQPVEA